MSLNQLTKGTPSWCKHMIRKAKQEMIAKKQFLTLIDSSWSAPCCGLKLGDSCDHDHFYNSMCQGKVRPQSIIVNEGQPFFVIDDCVTPNLLYKHSQGQCQYIIFDEANKQSFMEQKYASLSWTDVSKN